MPQWPDVDPSAAKIKKRESIDFNYTDPPREITDPEGFQRVGTTRAYEEYPKHVLVADGIAESYLPGALECPDRSSTIGYPFITVHDQDQEAIALNLGYVLAPVPVRTAERTHPAVLALESQRSAYAQMQAELEELRAQLEQATAPKKPK